MNNRMMSSGDIPGALILCRHAQWNQVARDWEMFLRLSPEGCRIAEMETIIGTVTTVRYQNHFSWIGMILVDPAYQRRGIGMQLLRESLEILKDEETVKLDASLAGRQLYLKLNFVDEYTLSRMIINPVRSILKKSLVRVIRKNEVVKLFDLDNKIFGANRQPLLEWLIDGAPQLAFMIEDKVEILGYCFGRKGENYMHMGPVVAINVELAKDLVLAALNNCIGQAVAIDIPHFDLSWKEWLESIGFEEQRPFYRMYLGSNHFPGVPENQFAILGPEFG